MMKRHNMTITAIMLIFILIRGGSYSISTADAGCPSRSGGNPALCYGKYSSSNVKEIVCKLPSDYRLEIRQFRMHLIPNFPDSQVISYQKEAVKKMRQESKKGGRGLLRYKSKHFYLFVEKQTQQQLGLSPETLDILLLSSLVILEDAYDVVGDDFGFKPSSVVATFYINSLGRTKGTKPKPAGRTITVSRDRYTAWVEISGSDVNKKQFDLMLIDMLYRAYTHLVLFYKGEQIEKQDDLKKHKELAEYEVKKALYLSKWTDLARLCGRQEKIVQNLRAEEASLKKKYPRVFK